MMWHRAIEDSDRVEERITVDPVLFAVLDRKLHVLLARRSNAPFKGCWGLPGGAVDHDCDPQLATAPHRILMEKSGVRVNYLEQVGTVGGLDRDPRGWSVTVLYCALLHNPDQAMAAGAGADQVCWWPLEQGKVSTPLAFDHNFLVELALERLRSKVNYTSIATMLLPVEFSFRALQELHELTLGRRLDRKSLMRRYLAILEPAPKVRGRAGQLYRMKEQLQLHYFTRTLEGSWKR